jgi:hypothetical protein
MKTKKVCPECLDNALLSKSIHNDNLIDCLGCKKTFKKKDLIILELLGSYYDQI